MRAFSAGVLIALAIHSAGHAQESRPPVASLSGTVLTADGSPPIGTATISIAGSDRSVTFDELGRFRFDGLAGGWFELRLSAAGHLTDHLRITIPPGRSVALPSIRLLPQVFLRTTVVTLDGQPVASPRFLSESFDVDGRWIARAPSEAAATAIEQEGGARFGPLSRGITEIAIDAPPYAITRLPALIVTGEPSLIDLGRTPLEMGATLHVQVVDRAGTPVVAHEVFLDEATQFSPIMRMPLRTDHEGRVTFDRLAAGRYRIRSRAIRRCGEVQPTISRWVDLPGRGDFRERLLAEGGNLAVTLTSGSAPLASVQIAITSDASEPAEPAWLQAETDRRILPPFGPTLDAPCTAMTSVHGIASLAGVPPGPARLRVDRGTSRWRRRVNIPAGGGELRLDIPPEVLFIRTVDAGGVPISHADVVWTGDGARVQGTSDATGSAVLDGARAGIGRVQVHASGYAGSVLDLSGSFEDSRTITLERPPDLSLHCTVVDSKGTTVGDAVVMVNSESGSRLTHVAMTDAKGQVRFARLARGGVRITAHAQGGTTGSRRASIPATGTVTVIVSKVPAAPPARESGTPAFPGTPPRGSTR